MDKVERLTSPWASMGKSYIGLVLPLKKQDIIVLYVFVSVPYV